MGCIIVLKINLFSSCRHNKPFDGIYPSVAGIILSMDWANERRRYIVTSFLMGWAHTQNDSRFGNRIYPNCATLPFHHIKSYCSTGVKCFIFSYFIYTSWLSLILHCLSFCFIDLKQLPILKWICISWRQHFPKQNVLSKKWFRN